MATLYDILGVAHDATEDQIKQAYKKLAREHHPDKGGDKAKFQEIQHAYETLVITKSAQLMTLHRHNTHCFRSIS